MTATVGAPPEEVWRLFADVERWPAMIKSIRKVRRLDSGPLQVGSEAIVWQPGLPRARWRVTELEPGRSFIWETAVRGVVTTSGGHFVDAHEQGAVITLSLRIRGPLAWLVTMVQGRRARRNLSMELEGFRAAAR